MSLYFLKGLAKIKSQLELSINVAIFKKYNKTQNLWIGRVGFGQAR